MKISLNKKKLTDIAFIVPSLAGVSIFVLIPFIDVLRRSFTNVSGTQFVFFSNYITIFQNAAFRLAFSNTIKYVWKNLGYNVVLWMAGLTAIPDTLYEAARADGANNIQCFRYITMPNLMSTLYTITVLAFLNSFKVFREAYLVAGDYPHESMYLLQHLFNNWFRELSLDKMSAAAVVIALLILVLILGLQRSWDRED